MPSTRQAIPSNWPTDLVYLSKPIYSASVSASLLTQPWPSPPVSNFSQPSGSLSSLCNLGSNVGPSSSEPVLPVLSAAVTASPSPLVRIARITDQSHPAYGQSGLFASQNLPPGSFVLCYLGWTHSMNESDPNSSYDLALDRDLGVAVDATRMGNEARFINDYRGVAHRTGPNAEFKDILVHVGQGLVERRVGIFVLPMQKNGMRNKAKTKQQSRKHEAKNKTPRTSGIAKGEEILLSYGKGFWTHHNTSEGAVDDGDLSMSA